MTETEFQAVTKKCGIRAALFLARELLVPLPTARAWVRALTKTRRLSA